MNIHPLTKKDNIAPIINQLLVDNCRNLEQVASFNLCLTTIKSKQPREFCRHWGKVPKKISTLTKGKLDSYYEDSVSSISMEKRWFTKFRWGRTSMNDIELCGRPVEVSTPEIIEKTSRYLVN